jgi:hypothetical protein
MEPASADHTRPGFRVMTVAAVTTRPGGGFSRLSERP